MKRYLALLLFALMFCSVLSIGCGGGSDSSEHSQNESLNNDTGSYDPNNDGRGTSSTVTDLSTITADYTAQDGETLTNILDANVKVSIADGATVTLKDVTINGVNNEAYTWAGLNCEGDAVIILEGTNSVKGFDWFYPGVHVPKGNTLTIKGKGSLTANSNGYGAGIGIGDLYDDKYMSCGNIVIEDGTITATGGWGTAGIGGGIENTCGNIVIEGGTINATGGKYAAGIGGGEGGVCGNITINGGTVTATGGFDVEGIGGAWRGTCGDITISDKVTKVTAIAGEHAQYAVGAENSVKCGTITLGGKVTGYIESPFTYEPQHHHER